MTNPVISGSVPLAMPARGAALAKRLEQGARALSTFGRALTEAQWHTRVPKDGRTIGVILHHVAIAIPFWVELAWKLAGGQPISGLSMEDVDAMNARYSMANGDIAKDMTLRLLACNGGAAAAAIRTLSDDALAQAAPVSFYGDAPLTCQFLLEDFAVRHSFHYLRLMAHALEA